MSYVKTYSKNNDEELQIAPNFKVKEFACHDGTDQVLIDIELLPVLQLIRDNIGQSININSGYRTQSYNKKVGGASNSFHLYGRAFDISVSDGETQNLKDLAFSIGTKGIIGYDNFVHMDSRDTLYRPSEPYNTRVIPFNYDLIKIGQTNYLVGAIQFKLRQKGYDVGNADWIFGQKTLQGVLDFQRNSGFANNEIDGIVGSQTWNRLFNNF